MISFPARCQSNAMPTVTQEPADQGPDDRGAADRGLPEIDLVHRAIDHSIDLREAVGRITDPLLHTLADMLLFELGRRLARLEGK